MIVLLILNLGIAVLIFLARPNNQSNRYLCCLYFLFGLDIFLKVTRDFFIYNSSFDIIIGSVGLRDKIMILLYIVNTLTYFAVPFLYFIFSLKYSNLSDWWHSKAKIIIRSALTVTIVAIVLFLEIFFPINYYAFNLRSGNLLLPFYFWNVILLTVSDYLLVVSYINEIKPRLKRERLIICTVLATCVTLSILTRYAFTLLRIQDTYTSINYVQFILCLLFLYFFSKYGIMGMKLSVEHYDANRYRASISSGTAILRHTIKNELIKMSICLQALKSNNQSESEIQSSLQIINNSIEHLKSLTCQMNDESRKIKLDISVNMLYDLVNETIESVEVFKYGKAIDIQNLCEPGLEVYCDKAQVGKALENILNNSMDAIENNGLIQISSSRNEKVTSVIIEDNGRGISRDNLKHVLEPYFTTKKGKNNFGIGLFHCSNLMEEHGGYIEIHSSEGKGTIVSLNFPNSRLSRKHGHNEVVKLCT